MLWHVWINGKQRRDIEAESHCEATRLVERVFYPYAKEIEIYRTTSWSWSAEIPQAERPRLVAVA